MGIHGLEEGMLTQGQRDFVVMLADTADVDGWWLRDGCLRSESGCCPILGVAGASLDDPPYTGNCAWDGYTEDCGLTFQEGKEIGEAADADYRSAIRHGYLQRVQELRAAMLEACGLREDV